MDFVGFRASHDAACLILVLGELLPIKVGQEGLGPRGNDRASEDVILVAEPPITSEGSESGVVFRAGLVLPVSPSHTTDGLNNLSKKILGGTGSCLAPMRARISTA